MSKPFSQACENNQQPILEVLRHHMIEPGLVNEIGSGTGQHAVFMARHLPHLQWQPSDVADNLPGIHAWRNEASLPNLLPPLSFDVDDKTCPLTPAPYLFSANTLHIMRWDQVEQLFRRLPSLMVPGGLACFYGPFNYHGQFTSESNARFDQWLKSVAPHRGIRDVDDLQRLAEQAGFSLHEDCAMPSNNRILIWQRHSG